MLAKLLDMNHILMALFIVGLLAVGALGTAQYASRSVPRAAPDQSAGIEFPTDIAQAQREIEAPQLNDTKALLTVALGGMVVFTVVGMGAALAFGCWLLDKLVKESPERR